MRIFLAGVSSYTQFAASLVSYQVLRIRKGDDKATNYNARGDVARLTLCNEFLRRKEFDAIFLADLDMKYPPGLLERLRKHDVDMVTGHYFKRQPNPIQSVVSVSSNGTWPYHPLMEIPDDGLHKVACTGFGNVLIKRHVIEDVIKMLRPGEHPFQIGPLPEMVDGDHGSFGADFGFFTRAQQAGYTLWMDAHKDAEARHAATLWVDRHYYDILRPYQNKKRYTYWGEVVKYEKELRGMDKKAATARLAQLWEHHAIYKQQYEEAQQLANGLRDKIAVVEGQIQERKVDIQEATVPMPEGGKKVGTVPVFESNEEAEAALANRGKGPMGESEQEVIDAREKIHTEHAREVIDILNYEYPPDEDT